MLIKAKYNMEVLDNGKQIVSADIKFSEKYSLKKKSINFSVGNNQLQVKSIEYQSDQNAHINFEECADLLCLKFDTDKFVNRYVLPDIKIEIDDDQDESRQIVEYKEPEFINEFEQKIFRFGNSKLSYYQFEKGNTITERPLVIFLHGSGERGFNDKLPLSASDIPKTIQSYIKENEECVFIAPQASWAPELNGWFRKDIRNSLMKLVVSIIDDLNIDKKRVYLTGVSNGGAATWHFAATHPDLFAAIVPCCGYIFNDSKNFLTGKSKGRYMAPTQSEAEALVNMPIWAFHAKDDNIVDVQGTIQTTDLIKNIGNQNVKVTLYEAGKVAPSPHASWELAFNNSQLLPWLFSQKLGSD